LKEAGARAKVHVASDSKDRIRNQAFLLLPVMPVLIFKMPFLAHVLLKCRLAFLTEG
jgi:hypothetical protein